MYFKGNRIISSSLILGTFSTTHLACSNGQVFAQKCENETNSNSSINRTQLKDQTKESSVSYIWWILAAIISVGGVGLIIYFLTYLFKMCSEAEYKRVVERKLSELEMAYTRANSNLQNENVELSYNLVSELSKLYESICLCEKVLKEYTSEVEAASLLKDLYSSLLKKCNIDCEEVRATLKDVSEAFCNCTAGKAMKILDKKRQNHIDFNVNNKKEDIKDDEDIIKEKNFEENINKESLIINKKEGNGVSSALQETDSEIISLMKKMFVLNREDASECSKEFQSSDEQKILDFLAKNMDTLGLRGQKLKFKVKDLKDMKVYCSGEDDSVDLFNGLEDNSLLEVELDSIIVAEFGEIRFKTERYGELCTKRLELESKFELMRLFNLLLEKAAVEKGKRYCFKVVYCLDQSKEERRRAELVLYKIDEVNNDVVERYGNAFVDNDETRLKNLFFVHEVLEENVENNSFVDFFDESENKIFYFKPSEIKKLRNIEATEVEVNIKSFLKILDRNSVIQFLGTNKSFADNDTVILSFINVGEQGCIDVKCTFKNSEDVGYFETKYLKEDQVDDFLNFLQNKQKAPDEDFKVLRCGVPPNANNMNDMMVFSTLLCSLNV